MNLLMYQTVNSRIKFPYLEFKLSIPGYNSLIDCQFAQATRGYFFIDSSILRTGNKIYSFSVILTVQNANKRILSWYWQFKLSIREFYSVIDSQYSHSIPPGDSTQLKCFYFSPPGVCLSPWEQPERPTTIYTKP